MGCHPFTMQANNPGYNPETDKRPLNLRNRPHSAARIGAHRIQSDADGSAL
jgi:hypothetical protein